MILRDNIPIYEQIKEDLLAKIKTGVYRFGQRLPAERALSERYGVSRVTVRQAISVLSSEGVLERRHGSGTYVCSPVISQPIAQLRGVVEELETKNIHVDIDVLAFTRITFTEKDAAVWSALARSAAEGVYKIKRLLSADGSPLLLDYNYLPEEIGVQFQNFNISRNVIFSGMDTLGYLIEFARQNISAKLATNSQARILLLPPHAPVLELSRVCFSKNETPLLFTRALFAGDRYSLDAVLRR